jgi:hypothetical protein
MSLNFWSAMSNVDIPRDICQSGYLLESANMPYQPVSCRLMAPRPWTKHEFTPLFLHIPDSGSGVRLGVWGVIGELEPKKSTLASARRWLRGPCRELSATASH